MTYFRNDKKRNGNTKTELGTTSIKNQQHIVQWPTSVAFNTHTIKGLGGVDISHKQT